MPVKTHKSSQSSPVGGGRLIRLSSSSCLNLKTHYLYYNDVPPDDFTLDGNVMHNI